MTKARSTSARTRREEANFDKRLGVRIPIAAQMLGIGKTKLYELIAQGEVEVVKIGKVTLITVRSLEALIDRHCAAVTEGPRDGPRRGRPAASFLRLRT